MIAANADRVEFRLGSLDLEDLKGIATNGAEIGHTSVWIPGCGVSPLARVLSHLGMQVIATDVSVAAVEYQRDGNSVVSALERKFGPQKPGGTFTAVVHDFREKLKLVEVDLIINVKAFQGFNEVELARIARIHAAVLRPGRIALFDTMNVQGERRDALEDALSAAGFIVPFRAVVQWFRRELRETRIPHVFVLGSPMIPQDAEGYEWGTSERDKAQSVLRSITDEYRLRHKDAEESEQKSVRADDKIAQMIYSTG